jgi:hypothetical protein
MDHPDTASLHQLFDLRNFMYMKRLEALPKECIANMYRDFVAPARRESKADMVTALLSHAGKSNFLAAIEREEDYARRVKQALKDGLAKPKF